MRFKEKLGLWSAAEALPGREQPKPVAIQLFVNGLLQQSPFAVGGETAASGLVSSWTAQRKFWRR